MLTKGMIRALKMLLASDDKEIVCDGTRCMIDRHTIHCNTVNGLLAHMAIKDAGYAGVGCRIYCPTENTPHIIARPALADEMVARVCARKPFFVDGNGAIQDV